MMAIYILILILEIIFSNNRYCKNNNYLSDKNCFNNILIFNSKKYRAGHFDTNKNGDLLIEFSEEDGNNISSRLFYGLKKDGSYFFPEGNHVYELDITGAKVNISDNNTEYYYGRYESNNLFVSLDSDKEDKKQYFLSVSSYKSIVELHDFNNINNITHYTWTTKNFFNLNNSDYIYSYQFSLFEIDKESNYILVFYPGAIKKTGEATTNSYIITKFKFFSSINNAPEIIDSYEKGGITTDRIIRAFTIDYYDIIVVVYTRTRNKSKYLFSIYNYSLTQINDDINLCTNINLRQGIGIFYKPVYIKDNYFSFIYFMDYKNGNSLNLTIFQLINDTKYTLKKILDYNQFNINFETNTTLSDFLKLDDKRLVFISTEQKSITIGRKLHILLFDLYDSYSKMKIRIYSYDIGNYKFTKELSCQLYNNYIVFTTTSINTNDSDNNGFFSLFMIISYSNGTDSIIDISKYFRDSDNYSQNFNFTEMLFNNLSIDNNIFGNIPDDKIKLISIPDEIIIYQDNKILKNNSNLSISNEYSFNQNKSIIKASKYYYIYYQYIIREADYEDFYDNAHDVIEYPNNSNYNFKQEFTPKYFYGRTNKLKFKLCHEYCETCLEISTSNDNQKCQSCLSLYQYDYWYFLSNIRSNGIMSNNCVPEGYYNDIENKILSLCNSTEYKYYYNSTNNKKICFSNKYECPEIYPTFNKTTNECLSYYCDYFFLKKDECNFDNFSNIETIYEKLKNEIISSFPKGGESIFINTKNNFTFQITTLNNELECLNGNKKTNSSILDFKGCTDLLIQENKFDEDIDLIVLKYERITWESNEKSIQYEIYAPNSSEKLNLSVCSDINIDLYVPIKISEETKKLYEDLNSKGYNLFDKNDKFYTDICTPYKSENGTDVPLSDRYNDFYNPNQLVCQANCQYSDYNSESEYLKCECNVVNNEKIETDNPEKVTAVSIFKTFYTVLKYSNYKVIKCKDLVFRNITFYKNKGSILTMIYFSGYIFSFFIFLYNNILYLKKEIYKLLDSKKNNNEINCNKIIQNNNNDKKDINIINNNDDKNNFIFQMPKSLKSITNKSISKNIKIERNKKKLKTHNIGINKQTKNFLENPPKKKEEFLLKSNSIKIFNKNKTSKKNNNSLNEKRNVDSTVRSISIRKSIDNKNLIDIKKLEKKDDNIEIKETEDLDDYEFNDLKYLEALEKDKRNFIRVYYSFLKREHIIIFTFLNCNDYNIFSIKLSKFFFLITTDMFLNVFFFSDESMHNIYQSGGIINYFEQLSQFIYSTIVSQVLQIFLNYLTMTDIHYYEIKEINNNIKDKYKVLNVLQCIKYKIIIYYLFSLLMFLFYWYMISAFCAVYENTQIIFLKDSISSFIMGLIYPFILYIFPTLLRFISLLPKQKKNLKFFYWLSDIIPFF